MRTEEKITQEMADSKMAYQRESERIKSDPDIIAGGKTRMNQEAHDKHKREMNALRRELRELQEAKHRKEVSRHFKLPENASASDALAFDEAVSRLRNETPERLVQMLSDGVTPVSAKAIMKAGYKKGSQDVLSAVSERHPELEKSVTALSGYLEESSPADVVHIDWSKSAAMKAKVTN